MSDFVSKLTPGIGLAGDMVNIGTGLVNLIGAKRRRKEQYAREDNAVQRRAADLEKAGLSKTLAAGSAAQASDPIRPSASNTSTGAMADAVESATKNKQTRAQTALLAQQSRFIDQQIEASKTAQDFQRWAMGPKGAAEISNLEANTGRTKAETDNVRQTLANLKETLEGLEISNDEKRALYDQLKKDLETFGDFNAPYTKELPFKSIPQTVANLGAGFMEALKNLAPEIGTIATNSWMTITRKAREIKLKIQDLPGVTSANVNDLADWIARNWDKQPGDWE